jgi:3-oxoacyl-[acyl-carrier-protein] synthase II
VKRRKVVITGLGVIAPNGIGKDAFWEALKEGKSGIGKITRFDASSYPSQIAGEVNGFDPIDYMSPKSARRIDRFVQFALAAARMAVEDAGLKIEKENPERMGTMVGTAMGGYEFAEYQHSILLEKGLSRVSPFLIIAVFVTACSSQIAMEFGLKGACATISTACASGTNAIGNAFESICNDKADIMIAGGSDATVTPLIFGCLCRGNTLSTYNQRPEKASRPFDRSRNGFVLGEGAGMVVLEELDHALNRGAYIYAEVVGYGATCDAHHMTDPLPDAREASRAIKLALRQANLHPQDVDYINAHGTATILNDKTETLAIKNVFGQYAYNLPISSTKSITGHLQGATGAVEIVACCLVMKDGIIPPTINYENPDPECDLDYVPNKARKKNPKVVLSNSFGFGGNNAVLVLRKRV